MTRWRLQVRFLCPVLRTNGGTGRHTGLRSRRLRAWGFNSLFVHNVAVVERQTHQLEVLALASERGGSSPLSDTTPTWWNGRHAWLKTRCP